jgi:hypothetical protein
MNTISVGVCAASIRLVTLQEQSSSGTRCGLFPTAKEVNEALRALAQIIRRRASSGKSTDTND